VIVSIGELKNIDEIPGMDVLIAKDRKKMKMISYIPRRFSDV
jgi:hypothetical protein